MGKCFPRKFYSFGKPNALKRGIRDFTHSNDYLMNLGKDLWHSLGDVHTMGFHLGNYFKPSMED